MKSRECLIQRFLHIDVALTIFSFELVRCWDDDLIDPGYMIVLSITFPTTFVAYLP